MFSIRLLADETSPPVQPKAQLECPALTEEPAYHGKPQYALISVGDKAEAKVWSVEAAN